jgi:hypothetical protein
MHPEPVTVILRHEADLAVDDPESGLVIYPG